MVLSYHLSGFCGTKRTHTEVKKKSRGRQPVVHRAAAGAYGECEKLGTVSPKQKGNVQTVICGFAQAFATFLENSVNVLKGFPFQTL